MREAIVSGTRSPAKTEWVCCPAPTKGGSARRHGRFALALFLWGAWSRCHGAGMAETSPREGSPRVAIPMVAEREDRSPGIRVNAMPFGEVDLTSIWGMVCDEEIPLYLDAGSGNLYALVEEDKNLPDQTICTAYGSGRYTYSVLFDQKNLQFIVQNKPVYRPI